jgi:hypothetical protein
VNAGITLAGLSAVATLLIGCAPDSSQVDVTQVAESEALSVNECDEVIATSQDYSDRLNQLTKMIDKAIQIEEPTRREIGNQVQMVGEREKMSTLIIYIVADNPQCFSPGLVAEARLKRDALLNN